MLEACKCDAARHGEDCPKWCALRPGGATSKVPYAAKATTITQVPPGQV